MNPPDQAKRDIIRDELDRCVWVEAGAGSGKTTELVARLVNLITRKAVPLKNIAAITFTRKAAAELKTRVQDGIERARVKETDPGRKARLEDALASMDALFAETIHSFCMQLLRERPLEAGVPPDFDLMDGAEEAALRAEVLHRGLDLLRRSDAALWEELRVSGIGPRELAETFARLCEHAEVDFPAGKAQKPDFKKLAKGLERLVGMLKPLLGGPEDLDAKTRIWYEAYQSIQSALGVAKEGGQAALVEALMVFKDPVKVSQRPKANAGWKSLQARMEAEQHFQAFQESEASPAIRAWQACLYGAVMEALLPLRDETLRERIRLGRLSQGDLLRLAARMLRKNPKVRKQLAKTYQYLFVDEFQDTDPIQAELMLLLTGESDGDDWTKQKPRPGSLFVVGDPKQSIYRFRRADISVFKQVKDIMLKAGASEAQLTSSFRSQLAVCEWINKVFKGPLPDAEDEKQAAYALLDPMRANVRDYPSGVYALDVPGGGKSAAPVVEAEADAIAKYIRDAVVRKQDVEDGRGEKTVLRPARWGDFLIIGRGKRHLAAYARALDRLNIPNEVTATDRGGLWDGLGVLLGLLKAAADPDDELAIVACLRGPAFGVSDDELYMFKAGGGRFRLTVEPKGKGPAVRAMSVLRDCWLIGRDKPVGLAIETILERTGLAARVRGGDEGSAQAADLMAAVSYLRGRGLAGETLVGALKSLICELEDNKGEAVSRPPLSHDPNRVRIMNLHKAKGLEGKFVFLVEPVMKCDYKPQIHIRRKGDRAEGYMPVQVKAGFGWRVLAAPEDWDAHESAEAGFEAAEKNRLQYVAATRAQDFLILTRCAEKIHSNYQVFGPLHEHLRALPALKIPKEAKPLEAGKSVLLSREKAYEARAAALKAALPASYELRAVTDIAKELPFDKGAADWGDAEGPGGMEWGSLIHKALEVLARSGERPGKKELSTLVVRLAGPGSSLAKYADKAVPLLENALKSEVWERMLKSPERYAEATFQVLKGKTVEPGVIDLVYRVDGGWEIVDFKTDNVGEDPSAWVEHYRPQLEEYTKQWQAITGEKVARKALLFVRKGQCACV